MILLFPSTFFFPTIISSCKMGFQSIQLLSLELLCSMYSESQKEKTLISCLILLPRINASFLASKTLKQGFIQNLWRHLWNLHWHHVVCTPSRLHKLQEWAEGSLLSLHFWWQLSETLEVFLNSEDPWWIAAFDLR